MAARQARKPRRGQSKPRKKQTPGKSPPRAKSSQQQVVAGRLRSLVDRVLGRQRRRDNEAETHATKHETHEGGQEARRSESRRSAD